MNTKNFLIVLTGLLTTSLFFQSCVIEDTDDPVTPANGFTDSRDGQTYATVQIGNQTWFAENLNYHTGFSRWYDNHSDNGDVYGRLYTWDAAMTACPDGWHLPTDEEWKTLEMNLGMDESVANGKGYRGTDEGNKMKSTSGWNSNGNGTNSSGFNALPGGYDNFGDVFFNLGNTGNWWTGSEHLDSRAWIRMLYYDGNKVFRDNYDKSTSGFSVRCLKD